MTFSLVQSLSITVFILYYHFYCRHRHQDVDQQDNYQSLVNYDIMILGFKDERNHK